MDPIRQDKADYVSSDDRRSVGLTIAAGNASCVSRDSSSNLTSSTGPVVVLSLKTIIATTTATRTLAVGFRKPLEDTTGTSPNQWHTPQARSVAPMLKPRDTYHHVAAELAGRSQLKPEGELPYEVPRTKHPSVHRHIFHAIELYRNNLIACSARYNHLFIATGAKIKVYAPSYPSQTLPDAPLLTLRGPETHAHLRSDGYINRTVPHTINNMIVADLGDEEVLLAANDNGYVAMWYTRHIRLRAGEMDMCFDVEASAWGLAVHTARRLIAVSANTTTISVYEMGAEGVGGRLPGGKDAPMMLESRGNNLPCVGFLQDDADGRWLVATDIAGAVMVYDLVNGRDTAAWYNGQGWTVTMVSKRDFLTVNGEEFAAVAEKARVDEARAVVREMIGFAMVEGPGDGDSGSEDWASDMQATLYAGEISDGEGEDEDGGEDDDGYDDDYGDDDDDDVDYEMDHDAFEEVVPDGNEGDEGEDNTPTVQMSEEAQTAAYGPIPPDVATMAAGSTSAPDEPPWDFPSSAFIIHSKEFGLKLLALREQPQGPSKKPERIATLLTLRNLIPADGTTFAAQTSRFPLRMNMHAYIPALSLFVVGRQDGRVALVRLVKTAAAAMDVQHDAINGKEAAAAAEYGCLLHLEKILPEGMQVPFALSGVCVAPVQGWEGRGVRRGVGERGGQSRWLYSSSGMGGRWRMFLLYSDGTVLCYVLTGGMPATQGAELII
ncbi:hypothetical protein DRE_06638 [Drechslerella stenobrocha 248]|uniref:Uncharacterized protein n=1 Tax=Drechslerella stenobrocha 248 TaxID=1043628 RepID=W7HWW5_9PEZI|nr:hypothetical protein DRE_06638 [Drechslerella stenobrocha 248]